jgi:hypothetical protein
MMYDGSGIHPWYIHCIGLHHIQFIVHGMHVIDYWCVPNTRYAYQQLMMYVTYAMDL